MCGAWWAKKYNTADRVTQFIIGLHNFIIGLKKISPGYVILVPGYKFCGWQFEILGYYHSEGGRRGLSNIFFYIMYFATTHKKTVIWVREKNQLWQTKWIDKTLMKLKHLINIKGYTNLKFIFHNTLPKFSEFINRFSVRFYETN